MPADISGPARGAEIPRRVGFAVLTVSDTRDDASDTSGGYLRDAITADGHLVVDAAIVPDDRAAITRTLDGWLDHPSIHAIIATGGTGLTGRDITPEVFHSLYDKEIDGFAVVFHMVSFASVGVSTLQSRATGGIARGTYLFALPGSTGAVRDGWEKVLRAEFDRTHRPCNLVELIPRLLER